MPRNPNNVLVGGGRVFINNQEIGWLAEGEIRLEEQSSQVVIKESEGATVVTLSNDKEVHFTFSLLEADTNTLRLINPNYSRRVYSEGDETAENEYIADLGASNGLAHIPVVESASVKVEPATTLVSAAAVDDEEIYVENIRRFDVGDTIAIVRGTRTENATVKTVDATQGLIELNAPLTNAFAAGSVVKITTASKALELGTDYSFYPPLGLIRRVETSTDALVGDGAAVSYTYHSAKGVGYAMGSFEDGTTYPVEFWHKKRDGSFRCLRFFKARLSGNFAPFSMTQDSESPIAVDLLAIVDDTLPTNRNIYEVIDYDASAAPNGGW